MALISKLLVVDPEERYSAEEVLAHPWICDKTKRREGDLGHHIQDGIGNILIGIYCRFEFQ